MSSTSSPPTGTSTAGAGPAGPAAGDRSDAPESAATTRVDGRDARWAAHRDSRRAELVRRARRAVHRLGPDLSMDELAAEMGTSKSIIYRYFVDKSGLQSAVGGVVIDDLRDAIAAASVAVVRPRDRIAAMVEVYLGIVESSAHVYTFVTQPEATATAGALRGFVAETEDIVAEALLPVLRPHGADTDADQALAALWASGVVGLARASAERWIAARGPGEPAHDTTAAAPSGSSSGVPEATDRTPQGVPSSVEDLIASLDRTELAARITDWLWEGAVGVTRRARVDRPSHPPGPPAT